MIALELIKLRPTPDAPAVVCEGCLPPDAVSKVTRPGRAVFLYPERELLRSQYFDRADKQDMLRGISRLADPEGAKRNVLDCAEILLNEDMARAESLGLKVLIRTKRTTPEEMLQRVEEHFGLSTA